MCSIETIANQLIFLEQLNPTFTVATVAELKSWEPVEVQEYARQIPGTDAFANTLRQSLLTLSIEKKTTPEINK